MSRIRTSSYLLVILVLLGLAGWGMFQVIGAQEEPAEPQALTREEEEALFDEAIARARSAVEDFVASGAGPCSLGVVESPGHRTPRYQDLDALINDVDLIMEGDLGTSSMSMPRPNTAGAQITTEFSIREVLLGSTSAETIVVEAGGSVMQNGGEIERFGNPNFDQCSVDHALLFLNERAEGVFGVVSQGFVTFTDGSTDASRSSDLFTQGVSVESLKADIRRIANDQQASGIPRGRLVCDSWRDSESYQDPKACPGDSFNPYDAFGLARVLEIDIRKLGADNQVLAARADVPPDTPAVLSMLALLDRTVSVEPGDDPVGDIISLKVTTTTTGTPPYSVRLEYEVATGSIWASGGRFLAPRGFGEALNAILEGS